MAGFSSQEAGSWGRAARQGRCLPMKVSRSPEDVAMKERTCRRNASQLGDVRYTVPSAARGSSETPCSLTDVTRRLVIETGSSHGVEAGSSDLEQRGGMGATQSKIEDLGLDTTTNCNVLSALSFARRCADTVLLLLITVQ